MMFRLFALVFLLFQPVSLMTARAGQPEALSLAGGWNVRLDPQNAGEKEGWYAKPLEAPVPANLPGSLTTNHLGDDVGINTPWMGGGIERGGFTTDDRYAPYRQEGADFKIPFWLQPVKYYKGKAWYQREILIPNDWKDKHIRILLERCHWGSTVWVDETRCGTLDSLSTPHRHDLGKLTPGKHRLTILIDNSYLVRVGPDASSITDHTQTNWNGIAGRMELSAHDPVGLTSQQIYPRNDGSVRILMSWLNRNTEAATRRVQVDIIERSSGSVVGSHVSDVSVPGGNPETQVEFKIKGTPKFWSEFTPELYAARTTVSGEVMETTFGFREIRADGRTLLVNGVPVFLRGNLDCGAFPLTGHPSTDVAEWKRIFRVYKSYGLNHARFHSWCPPQAAFIAADELGIYLQVECGIWRGTCPNKEAKPVEPYLYEESERICREFGNHPSFVLFTHGNEPWELKQQALSTEWVPAMKKLDPRHLVCAGAHYPVHPNNDYHNVGPGGGMNLRYHGGFNIEPSTDRTYESLILKQSAPVVSHEPGEWCAFPDLDEVRQYTGVMKARNFEIVRDFMRKNHLLDQAKDFLQASGKFQTLLYKEETEKFLRTRGLAGFQMLGLNDFPGQGTALVGVVNALWNQKPYVTPDEYKRFSGPVVPLALMEKRVWNGTETFTANIRVAQYGGKTLHNAKPVWNIQGADGRILASGALDAADIPVGNNTELGTVRFSLQPLTRAEKLTLHVSLEHTGAQNDWNFWVYPPLPAEDAGGGVLVCRQPDEALAELSKGSCVLLLPPAGMIVGKAHGSFQPIFWNKAWFPGQKEHTLGLLIQNRHPALADFPTDFHADWQWWDLMNRSKPMILDSLPPDFRAIVQPIDDWNTCRRLGTIIEAKCGGGRLLVASCDLESDLAKRPVARQLRASLLSYMKSPAFKPKATLTADDLSKLVSKQAGNKMVAEIKAGSQAAEFTADYLTDMRPDTFWHSAWDGKPAVYPHEIRMGLAKESRVSGLRLLPRQDGNRNGFVKDIEVLASVDGTTWSSVTKAALENNQEWKSISFPPVRARFLMVRALSPQQNGSNFASFAELDPVTGP